MTNDKQRERLIELIIASVKGCARNWAETIADYLLANGVIVPPCKVGDTAYFLISDSVAGKKYISPEPVVDVCAKGFYTSGHDDSDENGDLWLWSDVGEIVFLDKAKAEQALKGGVQGDVAEDRSFM